MIIFSILKNLNCDSGNLIQVQLNEQTKIQYYKPIETIIDVYALFWKILSWIEFWVKIIYKTLLWIMKYSIYIKIVVMTMLVYRFITRALYCVWIKEIYQKIKRKNLRIKFHLEIWFKQK